MTSSASQLHQHEIQSAIAQLRCCSQVNIQTSWLCCDIDLSIADVCNGVIVNALHNDIKWSLHELNAKGHIAWASGRQVLWMLQRLVVPQDLAGYSLKGLSLRVALTWWAELAQIYVDGQLVQEGDLFDCSTRILLSECVTPGEEFTVALRLVSPNHDDGALVRSLCIYESNNEDLPEPGFIADELAVLQKYLDFAPEKLPTLAAAVAKIDWLALPDREKFERSLFNVRAALQCFSEGIRQRRIQLLGHAHLDMAWLWCVSETWEVAQRTFTSVLNLLQEFPELTFCHSSPALYAWIEQHRPDLFTAIQQQVKSGRWEVVGGLWIEPELNIISGESIVRQLLYGQRYVQEKFGKISTIAWLPDSFGFCATLPQILALGGIEYFVTQKLRWNDTTKFPYSAFKWRSLDGTELFSLMSAPIGEGIDPIKMAVYTCDWETQTTLPTALWLPGVGDHGGGPTRDMLELHKRWQNSPFFPKQEFTTADDYLKHISSQNNSLTPVWNNELYLEFHRGCYTTHAAQKRWNRRCEGLLYQAELFAALATISTEVAYPQAELETAWKQVLFNQFHDILPGSAINQVYVEANSSWQEVEQVGTKILQQSLSAIASCITLPTPPHPEAQPIVVFNSLNWKRSEVVAISLPISVQDWAIYNAAGKQLPHQLSNTFLLFHATNIPAVGYSIFWLVCQEATLPKKGNSMGKYTESIPLFDSYSDDKKIFTTKNWILENELLQVTIDSKSGDLCSIFDKINQQEILSGAGNQLQAFQDCGQYWDAWNIDPNYAQHPLPPTELKSIQWLERGSIQTRVRVIRQLGESEFCQDYILQAGSPLLKIATTVDWQERQVLVKVAFPLNLKADNATYEIPGGAIQRPTQPKTLAEKAKWEVPALQWADLSTNDYGVSLLNDCKYGYDSQPNQLRLTLLRSPSWPDPEADRGSHEFTYAVYPHAGSWQSANTVRRGYELNLPLQVMLLPTVSSLKLGQLPSVGRLLNLSAENLILMAFKQSEDNPQQWILRCYECHGEPAKLSLQSDLGLSLAQPVDLLERSLNNSEMSHSEQAFNIAPWKIATFIVESNRNSG